MRTESSASPVGLAPASGENISLAGLPGLSPERLRGAAVLLAGAGNIGSHLAPLLARAGVGLIRIVDRDRVEERNRNNQDYAAEDVGRSKAEVLRERLHRQYTAVVVEAFAADLEDLPLGHFAVDVLLGALDSRRARQVLVSEMGWPLGIPVVDGGVGEGLLGRVQTFVPGKDSGCLECTWGKEDYRQLAAEYPCQPGARAATPPTPAPALAGATVAGFMAAECLALLAGHAPTEGREIAFDLWHRRFLATRLRRAPGCRFDHVVVKERLRPANPFGSLTVADLLAVVEQRFGAVPVQVECRRGLPARLGLGPGRWVAAEYLRPLAGQALAALGLLPTDCLRLGSATESVFCVFDGEKQGR